MYEQQHNSKKVIYGVEFGVAWWNHLDQELQERLQSVVVTGE